MGNRSGTQSVNIMGSSLSTDTAVIAIVDAAQAAVKRNAEKLHKQQHDAFALAARLTLDAKLVRQDSGINSKNKAEHAKFKTSSHLRREYGRQTPAPCKHSTHVSNQVRPS